VLRSRDTRPVCLLFMAYTMANQNATVPYAQLIQLHLFALHSLWLILQIFLKPKFFICNFYNNLIVRQTAGEVLVFRGHLYVGPFQ